MLKKRLITVLFVLPPVIFLVWYSPLTTALLGLIWGLMAACEFYRNIKGDGVIPLTIFGLAITGLLIVHPVLNINLLLPLLLTSSVVLPLIWLLFAKEKENAFARWAWTIAGAIYIGWLLSYLLALRSAYNLPMLNESSSRNWAFYALTVTIFSDSTAYFVGRAFGKHHLAPRVSPGKTWEGTFGGIFGAIIAGILYCLPTPLNLNIGYLPMVLRLKSEQVRRCRHLQLQQYLLLAAWRSDRAQAI